MGWPPTPKVGTLRKYTDPGKGSGPQLSRKPEMPSPTSIFCWKKDKSAGFTGWSTMKSGIFMKGIPFN